MDPNLRYSYLLMGSIFLVFWLVLFIFRKNLRKEMLTMSVLFGIAGLLVERIYLYDWWVPLVITKTRIGVEDFLFGFVIGGIAAAGYEFIFRKRLRRQGLDRKERRDRQVTFMVFGLFFIAMFGGCVYLMHLNTLNASIIAFVSGAAIIFFQRRDLMVPSFVTGFILVVLSFIVYSLTELVTPGWVQAFWSFKNIPNVVILAVPIDDIIWYLLAGIFICPLYEFWQEAKLIEQS